MISSPKPGCPEDPTAYLPTLVNEFVALSAEAIEQIDGQTLTAIQQLARSKCQRIVDQYNVHVAGRPRQYTDAGDPLPRPTLDDSMVMELSLLELLPFERLETKYWSLEHTYGSLVSAATQREESAALAKVKELQDKRAGEANAHLTPRQALIARMQDMVVGKHWIYRNEAMFSQKIDRQQLELGWWLVGGLTTLLVFAVPLLLCLPCRPGSTGWLQITTLLVAVGFSGLVGAVISTLRRLRGLANSGLVSRDPTLTLTDLLYGRVSVRLSITSGIVSAYVVFLLFLGGVSDLLPKLAPAFVTEGSCGLAGSCLEALCKIMPAQAADYAKLFISCLLAGFAERLVPDVLDRLAKVGRSKE